MRIVRDPNTAEDLAQEAYLRARKTIEKGAIEQIEAFLNCTVRNLAFDHMRRRKTRERVERQDLTENEIEGVPADIPSAEATVIAKDSMERFEKALAALPERTRKVFVLSRIEGWPYPRIAEELQISPRTVFTDLKLAMGHLREAVDEPNQT
ncbi:RNA polymerase sigma factor [Phyllobacterium sp. K27]